MFFVNIGVVYNSQRTKYIGGYFGFAIGFSILTLCRSIINLTFAIGASRQVCPRIYWKSMPVSTLHINIA